MTECQSSDFSMNTKLTPRRPGCFDCLLSMMPGCECPVTMIGEDNDPYDPERDVRRASRGLKFAWTGNAEYRDHSVIDWVVQRKLLLFEFLLKFATWRRKYQRERSCENRGAEMEITEHGVSSGRSHHDFTEFY